MANNSVNKELQRAVETNNLEEVKALLSAGAHVNFQIERDRGTLLHCARSVEITKELLLRGASVNSPNMYRETPLHSAVTEGKGLELVKELLKHGADVDRTNRKGNTALNCAVKKSGDQLAIIKELLEYGADINIRNREQRLYDNHCTPLDNAMGNPECAKLLIKFTLLKRFIENYKKIIDLDVYEEFRHYSEVKSYLEDCVCEVLQMKTDEIKNGMSLYDFVTGKHKRLGECKNQLSLKLSKIDYSERYPLYNDVIVERIQPFLNRAVLLKKLSDMKVYTKVDISSQEADAREIILDPDCTYQISENLSDDDLSNFIAAFDHPNSRAISSSRSSNHREDLEESTDEVLTSSDVKRARLE